MIKELDKFKAIVKGYRGDEKVHSYSKGLNYISRGTWEGLEKYGNPQLLTLLKLSKELNKQIIIKDGSIRLK